MTHANGVIRALVLTAVLAACGASRPEVARVGAREVDEADLRHAVALQRTLADLQGTPCGRPIRGETESSACGRAALSVELLWLAVADYADAHGISAPADEAEQAVTQLEAQVGAEELDGALARRGLSRDDLVALGSKFLTIRAVRVEVAKERVGRDELRRRYDEGILDFTIVDADHILVKTRAQALDAYARVKDATEARFVAVARQVSIEPGAEERGGRLGSAVASSYARPFAEAAAALRPGEVSGPVRTQFGWHVIYLVDKQITPFGDAEGQLVEPLADDAFRAWLKDRAADLEVVVNPRYGRLVRETFAVAPVRSTDPERDVQPST